MQTNSLDIFGPPASVASAAWLAIIPWIVIVGLVLLSMFLLPKIQKSFLNIDAVFMNAVIAVSLAGFIFSQTWFGSDDAYHYVMPVALFWLKYSFGLIATMFLALKSFLSTDYAKHLQGKGVPANFAKITTDTHEEQVVPAPKAGAPPMTGLAEVRPASEAPISSLNPPQGTK